MNNINKKSNFQDVYPVLANQWNSTFNGELKASDVAPHSNDESIWWKCSKGHSYQMSPNKRSRGPGCRFCKKQVSLIEYCLYLCILKSYPSTTTQQTVNGRWKMDIFISEMLLCIEYDGYRWHKGAVERDREKNNVLKGFGYKVVRIREEGLPFIGGCKQITVAQSRNDNGYNIIKSKIMDISRRLNKLFKLQINLDFTRDDYLTALEEIHVKPPKNALTQSNPILANEWCFEKNGELTPSMVTGGSHSEVYWRCKPEGHVWLAAIYSRQNNGCPYCNNQKVATDKSIFELERWILSKWDYKRNERKPINLSSGASKYVYLLPCAEGHKPRLDRLNRIIKDRGECKDCNKMQRSLGKRMRHILVEWNEELNKGIDPYLINPHAKTLVYLNCTCCSRPYSIPLRNRTRRKSSMCSTCDLKTGKKHN